MKFQDKILIAVAESSVIVRSGLVSVLKRLPDMEVEVVEVTSKDGIRHCMEMHTPQILIVNPQLEGWFDVDAFRQCYKQDVKLVSLLCSMVDSSQLKGYDERVTLFDDMASLEKKITELLNIADEEEPDQDRPQSARKRDSGLHCPRHDQ